MYYFMFVLLLLSTNPGMRTVQVYSMRNEELTNNNCIVQSGIEFRHNENMTELNIQSSLIRDMMMNLQTLNEMNEYSAGETKREKGKTFFCTDSNLMALQYGDPVSLTDFPQTLTLKDLTILDFYVVFVESKEYCLVSSVILSKNDCSMQLERLSNLTTFVKPPFPNQDQASNLFPAINAKFSPLYIKGGKLTFEASSRVCSQDMFYAQLSNLKEQLTNSLTSHVRSVYNFVFPLSQMDIRYKSYVTQNEKMFQFWQKCNKYHAPAVYRAFHLLLNFDFSSWFFPKMELNVASEEKNISQPLKLYLELLNVVCDDKPKDKRSVLSFLFGSDAEVRQLQKSNNVAATSLNLVRKNELLILSNQRSLVSSALHLKKNEENLNISFQALNRKLLQLIYDQALGRERMNKLNLHGRIRADYRIALSEAESARVGAEEKLESLLDSRQHCRIVQDEDGFFCPTGAPSFHIATDLIMQVEAIQIKSQQTIIFHCLPMLDDSSGQLSRFNAHRKHFIKKDNSYIGSDFSFPESCLSDNQSCRNLYTSINQSNFTPDFASCAVVSNSEYIFVSCVKKANIRTESGLNFKPLPNTPTRIKLSQLPLYSMGQTFDHSNLYIRDNSIRRQVSITSSEEDTVVMMGSLDAVNGKTLEDPEISIQNDINKFFSPERISGSHIMSAISGIFAFIFAFITLTLCMKVPCCRSIFLSIVDTLCKCKQCNETQPSPNQGPTQAPETVPMLRSCSDPGQAQGSHSGTRHEPAGASALVTEHNLQSADKIYPAIDPVTRQPAAGAHQQLQLSPEAGAARFSPNAPSPVKGGGIRIY